MIQYLLGGSNASLDMTKELIIMQGRRNPSTSISVPSNSISIIVHVFICGLVSLIQFMNLYSSYYYVGNYGRKKNHFWWKASQFFFEVLILSLYYNIMMADHKTLNMQSHSSLMQIVMIIQTSQSTFSPDYSLTFKHKQKSKTLRENKQPL